jgi:protein phosphatase
MLGDSISGNDEHESSIEELNMPAALTDIGCEREINEDRYAIIESTVGKAWVVCDGMGGAVGGELAAQLAIDTIKRALESRSFESPEQAIVGAVEEANRVIMLRRQNPAFSSMGTTIVAALVADDHMVLVSAGDSRAYLISDGNFKQLSVDHTYVQELVDRGAVTPEEALNHPHSHVLTRCLGAEPRLKLDRHGFWIWEKDEARGRELILLCSDGLYSLVSDEEIAAATATKSPEEACVYLVELAKSRGGYDNITVIILPIEGRLRTEEPPKRMTSKRPAAPKRTADPRPRVVTTVDGISPGKKFLMAVTIFFVGSMLTALISITAFSYGPIFAVLVMLLAILMLGMAIVVLRWLLGR